MILEEMYNGRFYPCETVVTDSPKFKQAVKASAALMNTLSERLSKEDYALVEELREQVQEIIDRRPTIMKGNACPFYNLFQGLVYCATCVKSMQVRYEKVGRTGKNRFTGEMREPIDKAYYICQTYNRLGKNACTSHKIEARDLYNLVLKDMQEMAAQAMKDADTFYQRLSSRMERRYLVDASQTEKERKRLEARNQEIDGMFLSLYTDKAKRRPHRAAVYEADGGAGTGAGSQPEAPARSGGDAEPGGCTGKRSPHFYQGNPSLCRQ